MYLFVSGKKYPLQGFFLDLSYDLDDVFVDDEEFDEFL